MPNSFALILASGNGWHHGLCWIVVPILLLLLAAIAAGFFWRRGRGSVDGGAPQ
jgi:hypothetical protein